MSARTPGGRSPASAPLSSGAGSFSSVALAVEAIAASSDSDSKTTTVRASSGRSPGPTPRAASWRSGAGAPASSIFRATAESFSMGKGGSTLPHHRQGQPPMALAPAKNYSAGHGCLRLRPQRRARDDDRAARQPESPHRLQAPRSEPPDVLAAHRRQRRVRRLLQGRQGRRRPPAGARHPRRRRTSRF